jgi:TetR/AcrR family transcriptional regulator, fatty acid metabolism regulator protein
VAPIDRLCFATLPERTTDRRRELLDAAVRVFAQKGFGAARVGDIAEEAGVAHGLLYHYFRSKDEVLKTIFSETWELLQADTERIEQANVPLREQLRRFAAIYLGSWLTTPELVSVLVREIARSGEVGDGWVEIQGVIALLQAMIASAKSRGDVRADCDVVLATWAVYGALEEILTGWVLGQLPAGEKDVERAVGTVVDVTWAGLAA